VALGGRLVASCGGANGGKTGDEGGGGWRPWLREKEERGLVAEKSWRERRLVFFWFLDPIFSSLPNVKSAPVYRVEEGNLVFTRKQISALDSVRKDPNCWLKVGMVHCQICSCRLPEVASLGWCHVRLFVSEPVTTIPRRRGMSGD
jgi:hypothetical protein